MCSAPEPKGKLGAMTEHAAGLALAAVGVNGPEDVALDWDAIDWRAHEDNVGRLRQRIFKASQAGDLKKVRNLQKLLLRSLSNTLVSVRQVTQRNAGRKTAGVDGAVALTSPARAELARWVHHNARLCGVPPISRRVGYLAPAGAARVPEGSRV